MDNDKKLDQVLRIAEVGNYKLHAENLMIPVLKGLEIRNVDNAPEVLLFADSDTLCEQLISDGHVEKDEVKDRLKAIIETTKSFMNDIGCIDVDNSFIYLKDFATEDFEFKEYVQDIIFEEDSVKRIIRQINAYFYEPVMEDYYQFSLSTGPYEFDHSNIVVGEVDFEHDEITTKLDVKMDILLQNIRYHEKKED